MKQRKQILIRVDRDIYRRFRQRLAALGETAQAVIEDAIIAYIEEEK